MIVKPAKSLRMCNRTAIKTFYHNDYAVNLLIYRSKLHIHEPPKPCNAQLMQATTHETPFCKDSNPSKTTICTSEKMQKHCRTFLARTRFQTNPYVHPNPCRLNDHDHDHDRGQLSFGWHCRFRYRCLWCSTGHRHRSYPRSPASKYRRRSRHCR